VVKVGSQPGVHTHQAVGPLVQSPQMIPGRVACQYISIDLVSYVFLAVLWLCCGYALAVLWLCCGYALAMLWLCSDCALAVPWLCSDCALALLWLCRGYALAVLWLCCGYALTMLWLYSDEALAIPWLCCNEYGDFRGLMYQHARSQDSRSGHL
jgi:hypothetical protein